MEMGTFSRSIYHDYLNTILNNYTQLEVLNQTK